jgi:hypothetical protein
VTRDERSANKTSSHSLVDVSVGDVALAFKRRGTFSTTKGVSFLSKSKGRKVRPFFSFCFSLFFLSGSKKFAPMRGSERRARSATEESLRLSPKWRWSLRDGKTKRRIFLAPRALPRSRSRGRREGAFLSHVPLLLLPPPPPRLDPPSHDKEN